MGAGPTQNQVYGYVYRQLQKTQKELAKKGVSSTYKEGQLNGGEDWEHNSFVILYRRSNASNGECALWPSITIRHPENILKPQGKSLYKTDQRHYGTNFSYREDYKLGLEEVVRLFGGNNGPTQ